MTSPYREHLRADEHAFIVCMERVQLPTGANIVLADIDGDIELQAYQEGSDDPIQGGTHVIDKASIITDSLNILAPWDRDTTGYNFRYEVDGTYLFTDGGHRIDLEFIIHTNDHGIIRVVKYVTVLGVRSR